jgi:putative peptidoglycan lipid II flippase
VILGACLHLAIQIPGLAKYQFRWRPVIGWRNAGVLRTLGLLWPRVLTMASIHAYFIARDSLASRFGESGIGALNLGWTIQQVPETIIGTAIAITLLPTLAGLVSSNESQVFTETVNRALRVMLALCLPAAVLIAVGVRPLVEAVFHFETGHLDLVTWCTWAFLLGLLGDTWLETAVRSFYANQNTRTPLIAAFSQAVVFIFLAWLLSRLLGLPGIPLAAALTFSGQAIVLLSLLNRKYPDLIKMGSTLPRTLLAALLGGGVALAGITFLPFGSLLNVIFGLSVGLGVSLPFLRPELRLLLHL